VATVDREVDILVWNLVRGGLTRATVDPAIDHAPMWTSDNSRLIFSSDRVGTRNLFWQNANGTGAPERIGDSPNRQSATGVSPDGRHVIVTETSQTTGEDVMRVELSGRHAVTPLVQTPFIERNGVVSPNGRWLAYETNRAGRSEIWVQPYPDATNGGWQVSIDGGTRPLWARDGKELFLVSLTGTLMRVGVESGATWGATLPTQLIGAGYMLAPPIDTGRSYDVSPDGKQFLVIKDSVGSTENGSVRGIIVVQQWGEELKKLVPTK
jgi:serine/threonine-protein kinase